MTLSVEDFNEFAVFLLILLFSIMETVSMYTSWCLSGTNFTRAEQLTCLA